MNKTTYLVGIEVDGLAENTLARKSRKDGRWVA